MPSRGTSPSGCRHLVLATSMWLAPSGSFAANIDNPADISPRRKDSSLIHRTLSFPRKRRKDSSLIRHTLSFPRKRRKDSSLIRRTLSFPRKRRKDSSLIRHTLSFPCEAGERATAGAGAPANSAAGPKGERQDGASQADGAIVARESQLLLNQTIQFTHSLSRRLQPPDKACTHATAQNTIVSV